MSEPVEVIKSVNDLINGQADQLWTISISIIAAEVFMVAHLNIKRTLTIGQKTVRAALVASALCHFFALLFGYFSKGALIEAMIRFAKGQEWSFPDGAALCNFLQVCAVTLGLVIFVVCFYFYSKELAHAMTAGE